jgi:hypothetical protein
VAAAVSGNLKAQNARASRRTADMKKTGIVFVLLAIFLMSCNAALAQKPASNAATVTPTPDLSKFNIEKILQQVQTTNVQASAEEASPLQVVAAFLQLQPAQVNALEQLLQGRQATLVPLAQTAQALIQQLGTLLNSGGNPAQIGILVVHIHAVQQQMGQVQQAFLTQFTGILDAEQLQKLQAVQIAAQLQPILPVFQPIFLF